MSLVQVLAELLVGPLGSNAVGPVVHEVVEQRVTFSLSRPVVPTDQGTAVPDALAILRRLVRTVFFGNTEAVSTGVVLVVNDFGMIAYWVMLVQSARRIC